MFQHPFFKQERDSCLPFVRPDFEIDGGGVYKESQVKIEVG